VKMLGKLQKVDLRKAWKHEALDFTNWLAEEENLSLLSDEIGIGIKLLQTEAKVGNYNVDILAEDENTNKKIIIENQLEQTNHDHLGKIITYASGYEAEIIIWIVSDIRDEHKRAVEWLNEHTDDHINFFLVKMELWQIGESPFAPKFQIICQPNEWAKALKESVTSNLTDTKVLQLDFWNKFKEYASANKTKLKLRKADPQHWFNISYGSSESHICLTLNTRESQIACEIYIDDSKELFNHLFSNKDNIEKDLGEKLEWLELPGKKASRIKIVREGDVGDTNKWEEYFAWFKNEAEKFHDVFKRYLK